MWGATSPLGPAGASAPISIHAPRVGSDVVLGAAARRYRISIHAPRVGSDEHTSKQQQTNPRFQSTLPVWGATLSGVLALWLVRFQSTLPVWGATANRGVLPTLGAISIHAPRVGSDSTPARKSPAQQIFQSTLPVWGATASGPQQDQPQNISIHAPRVGSD